MSIDKTEFDCNNWIILQEEFQQVHYKIIYNSRLRCLSIHP
jgi:hypothetical protein